MDTIMKVRLVQCSLGIQTPSNVRLVSLSK